MNKIHGIPNFEEYRCSLQIKLFLLEFVSFPGRHGNLAKQLFFFFEIKSLLSKR